jgi:hypothetical protein
VREKFVPVSFEIAYVNRRPDAEGRFFREKLKIPSFNGWMAVTPNGKILNNEPYLDLVLQRGLEKWNELPEAERKPGLALDDLGAVDRSYDLAPPSGGLILNVSIRSLARDAKGDLYRPAKVDLENAGAPPIEAQAQRDHLWMTEAEAAALIASPPARGTRYPVPAFLADRIFRFYLKDSATCIPGTSAGKYGTYSGALTFEVLESSSALLRLSLSGKAQGGGPEFQVEGLLDYAPARKTFTRFDLVAFSERGHVDKKSKDSLPLGIAFELGSGERAMDRVPPYFFTLDHWADSPKAMADVYFGSRK